MVQMSLENRLGGVVEDRQDKIGWPNATRLLYDLGIPTAETLATDTEPWKPEKSDEYQVAE